ncbi:MAG: hypothetical protein ACFFG0_12870 [Candidatus Thorarchaeota archaeon]
MSYWIKDIFNSKEKFFNFMISKFGQPIESGKYNFYQTHHGVICINKDKKLESPLLIILPYNQTSFIPPSKYKYSESKLLTKLKEAGEDFCFKLEKT